MSGYRRDNFNRLFDQATGQMVGYVDDSGIERLMAMEYAAAAPQGTLAQRESATALRAINRQRYITTDTSMINGATDPRGTEWISDGTIWRPRFEQTVVIDTTTATGAQQTADQVLKTYTVPAGLLYMQRFRLDVAVGKTGFVDALQAFSLRLGTLGTVADQILGATATALLSIASSSIGFSVIFEAINATTVLRRGTGGGLNLGSFLGQSSNTSMDASVTVANLQTTPLKLTMSASMVLALADKPQVGGIRLTVLP